MKEKQLVSIIVPVYNVEKYIERCIDSILEQSYEEIEVLLIDDGSTDNSGKICDEASQKDKRITVVHKKNGGLSDARNVGLELCKGDWILFVDSDDCINKYVVQICIESATKKDGADIIWFNYTNVEDNQNVDFREKKVAMEMQTETGALAVKRCFMNVGSIVVWNKMYKRSLFQKLRFPKGKIHEDEFLTYKLLYNAKKVGYIDVSLYYYTIRNNSIMRTEFNKKRLVLLEVFEERIVFFKNRNEQELYEISVMQYYHILRTLYALSGQKKEYIKEQKVIVDKIINYSSEFLKNKYLSKIHKVILRMTSINYKILNIYSLKIALNKK